MGFRVEWVSEVNRFRVSIFQGELFSGVSVFRGE